MKICTSCKVEKPINDFSPSKKGLFGVQAKCKPCYAELMRTRREIDPTYNREYSKRYCKENRKQVLAYNREYRKNNPDKVSEWKRQDRINNKSRILADNAKRRSITKGPVTAEVRMMYALRDFYQAMSLGEPFHVDHITPVCKGGFHVADNLQVIPAIDNLRKGSRHEK